MIETLFIPTETMVSSSLTPDQRSELQSSVRAIAELWEESGSIKQEIIDNPFSSPYALYARVMIWVGDGE